MSINWRRDCSISGTKAFLGRGNLNLSFETFETFEYNFYQKMHISLKTLVQKLESAHYSCLFALETR